MKLRPSWLRVAVGSAGALLLAAGSAGAQTLQWLGATDGTIGDGVNVSADGSTLVFRVSSSEARRWTALGGSVVLGTSGTPRGISGDGTTIVGRAPGVYGFGHAWRWTAAGGLTVMPVTPSQPTPNGSYAAGISVLGRVAGGASTGFDAPAYWETTGSQTYIDSAGLGYQAFDISPDGSVIVGYRLAAACGQTCAMRWTDAGGGSFVGSAIGTNPNSGFGVAIKASSAGAVILGVNDSSADSGGWTWTAATGIQLLDTGGMEEAVGLGISHDGSLIVGYVATGANNTAAAWAGVGAPARTLAQLLLEDYGYSVGADFLALATDVSGDGRVIVGKGRQGGVGSTQVFRLELPAPAAVPALGSLALGAAALLLLTSTLLVLQRPARRPGG